MAKGFSYNRLAIRAYYFRIRMLERIVAWIHPDLDEDEKHTMAWEIHGLFHESYHQTKGEILAALSPSRPGYLYQLYDSCEYWCAKHDCSAYDCRCLTTSGGS